MPSRRQAIGHAGPAEPDRRGSWRRAHIEHCVASLAVAVDGARPDHRPRCAARRFHRFERAPRTDAERGAPQALARREGSGGVVHADTAAGCGSPAWEVKTDDASARRETCRRHMPTWKPSSRSMWRSRGASAPGIIGLFAAFRTQRLDVQVAGPEGARPGSRCSGRRALCRWCADQGAPSSSRRPKPALRWHATQARWRLNAATSSRDRRSSWLVSALAK